MKKHNSPYTATITGCAFLFNEFMRVLPLMMSDNSDELLKEELKNNNLLQVNSQKARQNFLNEFKRRYASVPQKFWESFLKMSEQGQRAALLYAILKTYKLVFDFHFNVTIKRWNSINQMVTKEDIMMEFSEISSRDEFVDGWTDNTKSRCASHYLTILRGASMLDKDGNLQPLRLDLSEYEYYLRTGEEWFLDACLLYPYEVTEIKARL